MRKALVWLHRWAGLLMAAFLIFEGLSGSLLAFRMPLERLVNPQLFATEAGGSGPLDLATLAERAEAQEPHARIDYFSVDHDQALIRVSPRIDPATGRPWPLDVDHVFLDPYSGRELGARREGDISQGPVNLIAFLYALHMNLASGTVGTWVLGIVALAWSLDCFVGLYLTMPVALGKFMRRWRPSWLIKLPASSVRINFDLHRAGGLWLWPLLFIFAWSSVMFNLIPVYVPVMRSVFDYRDPAQAIDIPGLHASPTPRLHWRDAQAIGERSMQRIAARRGFRIIRPYGMGYIESLGVYVYAVDSTANVQRDAWSTSVWVDGDTGDIRDVGVPSGEHTGNTVETWLRALHFADLRDLLAYRALVAAMGVVLVALSVTGIYVWLKKRRARLWSKARAVNAPGWPHPSRRSP